MIVERNQFVNMVCIYERCMCRGCRVRYPVAGTRTPGVGAERRGAVRLVAMLICMGRHVWRGGGDALPGRRDAQKVIDTLLAYDLPVVAL